MQESFVAQVARLQTAGFPVVVLTAVAESLLQKVKGRAAYTTDTPKRKKPVVVPYVHRVAHNLKNVANRHRVPVVFSAPRKLASLCPKILRGPDNKKDCLKGHTTPYVGCATGVVYMIPLVCGKVYIGQTGRCVNDRLREHQLSIKNGTGSHLPHHCKNCENKSCKPQLEKTTVLGRSKEKVARELIEAFHIRKNGDNCVSEASLSLYCSEYEFLNASL